MTFAEFYRWLRETLAPVSSEYADYEARQIACVLCGGEFAHLLADRTEITSEVLARANRITEARLAHVPLAYALGRVDFYGLSFAVTPDVLIPRADTEILCERVIRHLPENGTLLDVCTGSGCIALAAAYHMPHAKALGVDISEGALTVARQNAAAFSLAERVKFACADLFRDEFWAGLGSYDVICSNPPYIATSALEALSPEVKREPRLALDGGADGLRFYRRLLAICPEHLRPGGTLLLEIGYDQGAALCSLAAASGYTATIFRDFGGNDRVCEILF